MIKKGVDRAAWYEDVVIASRPVLALIQTTWSDFTIYPCTGNIVPRLGSILLPRMFCWLWAESRRVSVINLVKVYKQETKNMLLIWCGQNEIKKKKKGEQHEQLFEQY